MAYTRIPSQQIVYSLVEEERGKDAGRMQTVFLRVSLLCCTVGYYMHLLVTTQNVYVMFKKRTGVFYRV